MSPNKKFGINAKGFTLIEVFLVASLVSVVLLAIFSTYNSGIRIWRGIKSLRLLEDRQFYISIEKIKKELMGYIRDFKDISFEGNKKELSFPTLSGLEIVKVTYTFDKNGKKLLRKELKYSDSLKDKMSEKKTILFDAQDFNFSYLFYDKEDESGEWVTDFVGEEKGIPKAIKLNIKRDDNKSNIYIFIPD